MFILILNMFSWAVALLSVSWISFIWTGSSYPALSGVSISFSVFVNADISLCSNVSDTELLGIILGK